MTSAQGPATAATPKDHGDGRGFSVSEPRDKGPLRQRLEAEAVPLRRLTVLASKNDPFRVDTEAGHRDGAWLAEQIGELKLGYRTVHLRGLHYALIGRPKPNGLPYTNTDADWQWLQAKPAKAARWLEYIPFQKIVDERNAEPTIREFVPADPQPYVDLGGVEVYLPDDIDDPTVGLSGCRAEQPFHLVLYGEKSSLAPVLAPLADKYEADLYLPTGEISDTLMAKMARTSAHDGRPLVVLTFSDCDPSGWQMPISIGRKLQALQTLLHPDLEFQVHRVGLLPDQVREYGLPSTPLKDTETRADKWTDAMGVEQTEIDALAALQPTLLRTVAIEMLDHFYDHSLQRRVWSAEHEWRTEAQAMLADLIDNDQRQAYRDEAMAKLAQLQQEIDALNNQLHVDASGLDLPEFVMPTAEMPPPPTSAALVHSQWSFADQCSRLIDAKEYRR